MNKIALGLFIAALSFSAIAAETPAVMDTNSCKQPVYPKVSLMNEETGTVVLAFNITTDGKVSESKIEKSSGFKGLDKTALSALSLCKFKPATKDGKPEQVWTKVNFDWKLD